MKAIYTLPIELEIEVETDDGGTILDVYLNARSIKHALMHYDLRYLAALVERERMEKEAV